MSVNGSLKRRVVETRFVKESLGSARVQRKPHPFFKGFASMSNHPNPEVSAVHHARLLPILSALVFPSLPRRLQPNAVARSVSLPLPSLAPRRRGWRHGRGRRPVLPLPQTDGHSRRRSSRSLGRPVEPSECRHSLVRRQCDGDSGRFELCCWCCFFTSRTSCRGRRRLCCCGG